MRGNRVVCGAMVGFALGLAVASMAAATVAASFVSTTYAYSLTLPGPAKYWSSTYALIPWTAGSLATTHVENREQACT
jgi:hypothetical protein